MTEFGSSELASGEDGPGGQVALPRSGQVSSSVRGIALISALYVRVGISSVSLT